MKTKSRFFLTLFALFALWGTLCGQVTIGSGEEPARGALLQLKTDKDVVSLGGANATQGLGLPRVYLENETSLLPMFKNDADYVNNADSNKDKEDANHVGLTVYNISEEDPFCPGVYVWNGKTWERIQEPCSPKCIAPPIQYPNAIVNLPNMYVSQSVEVEVQVTEISGDPGIPYTFQWYDNGQIIDGATTKKINYEPLTEGSHQVTCVVTGKDNCNSSTSFAYKVTANINPDILPVNPKAYITGKTCFDIAYSNDNDNTNSGPLSARQTIRTDFSVRTKMDPDFEVRTEKPTYSGVQVYTFTSREDVKNLRFQYANLTDEVVVSMIPEGDYSGTITANTTCKAVVSYKVGLNETLKGKTRTQALKADLYAVFTDIKTGKDMVTKIRVGAQDAACCGAMSTTGKWLTFMCDNLGAEDVVMPADTLARYGHHYYQWGRKGNKAAGDEYYLKNSPTTRDLFTDDDNPILATDLQATTPSAIRGRFILSTVPSLSQFYVDWLKDGNRTEYNLRWGDGTNNMYQSKATEDPCPSGWKVPSSRQWQSLYKASGSGQPENATANTWEPVAPSLGVTLYGFKVGEYLYLPAIGIRYRNTGLVTNVNMYGYYQSSTVNTSNSMTVFFSYDKINSKYTITPSNYNYRAHGFPVRCVAEEDPR